MIDPNKQPDPKIHLYVSLIKSVVRIAAGLALINHLVVAAGWLLIAAEALGVLEELF